MAEESQLTPEQQEALLELAHEMPARSDIVKQQLAQAKALRDQQTQVPAYGKFGPAFNGLGNAISGAVGAYREKQLRQEQLKNAQRIEELLKRGSPFQQKASGMRPGELDAYGQPPLSPPPLVNEEEDEDKGFVPFGL